MKKVLYKGKCYNAYSTDNDTYVLMITFPVDKTECVNLLVRTDVPKQVICNVLNYFEEKENSLSIYEPVLVLRASEHPEDNYLYHVIAKKRNSNEFACWTSWNETTQSLNFGHYGLETEEKALEILDEYYHRVTVGEE